MEGYFHIGQPLRGLKSAKKNEAVTICEGRVQSGTQFVDRIASLSIGLRKLGLQCLQCGARVAIAGLNSECYLEWLLGVPSAGGIIAPLNHRWSVEEASEAIQEIGASMLVLDDHCISWSSVVKACCPSLVWIVFAGDSRGLGNTTSLIDAESIIQLGGPEPELQLLHAPQSIALICFTSGTTGRPKGVSLSHKALIVQSLAKISVVGYSQVDVYLHTATLGHIGGISSTLATAMAHGCHIILPKFQPDTVLESIDKYKVSTMIVVPSILNDMIAYWHSTPRIHEADSLSVFPTVSIILNGAGSLSPSQLEIVKNIFPASRIMSAYGMTEACSSITFLLVHDPQPSFRKVTLVKDLLDITLQQESEGWKTFHLGGVCVGKPAPHVEVQIKSQKNSVKYLRVTRNSTALRTKEAETEQSTSKGKTSSARLSSPPKKHISRDENAPGAPLTAGNVMTRDGWLDTGDVGWIDDLGQLWLLGRQKDVIRSGGENIYASEVEAVLGKHPAVLAVAVVGIPDDRFGEAVSALVRVRPEWRWDPDETTKEGFLERLITETLLRAHCRQLGLSRYKVPRFIVMQDELFPITSTGKVKKDQVPALVMAQLEARHLARERAPLLSKHSTPDNQKIIQSHL